MILDNACPGLSVSVQDRSLSNLYDRLESHVLPDWSDYVHLRELSLGNVGLGGTLPASLGNLRALRHLDLHNNRFHGSLPADWGLMENLKFLDLSLPRMDLAARLVSSLPVSWKDLDKLQVLDLRNQNIHGITPPFSQIGWALC